jgi:hypothetical protein
LTLSLVSTSSPSLICYSTVSFSSSISRSFLVLSSLLRLNMVCRFSRAVFAYMCLELASCT